MPPRPLTVDLPRCNQQLSPPTVGHSLGNHVLYSAFCALTPQCPTSNLCEYHWILSAVGSGCRQGDIMLGWQSKATLVPRYPTRHSIAIGFSALYEPKPWRGAQPCLKQVQMPSDSVLSEHPPEPGRNIGTGDEGAPTLRHLVGTSITALPRHNPACSGALSPPTVPNVRGLMKLSLPDPPLSVFLSRTPSTHRHIIAKSTGVAIGSPHPIPRPPPFRMTIPCRISGCVHVPCSLEGHKHRPVLGHRKL